MSKVGNFAQGMFYKKEKKKYLEKNEKENTKTLQNNEAVLREKFISVNVSIFFFKELSQSNK